MNIVIVCPVNQSTVKAYTFEDDISRILDEHMEKEHTDWFKQEKLEWFPRAGMECPMCGNRYKSEKGIDQHVVMSHKEYVRIESMRYALREEVDA